MSALGDYIHLNTENYLTYGIAKKGQNPKPFKAPQHYLQNRLKGIPSVNKKTIQTLERRLAANTAGKIAKDKKAMNSDMQQKINKLYELVAQHTETGLMGYFHGTSSKGGWTYTGEYQDLKALTLNEAEIARRKAIYEALNKKITEVNQRQMIEPSELIDIVQLYESAGNSLQGVQTESILGHIQEAIHNTSFNTWKSHVVGEFGEGLVALCADKVEKLSTDAVEEFLKESVVGSQTASITLNKDRVAQDLSSYLAMDKNGTSYSWGATRNKVDVKIQINQQDVLASVKNYYDAKMVTLQSQVNLFTTLAFLESKQRFGTHWLNMHSGSLKGALRNEADKVLKQEIAFEALVSGNPLKKGVDNANLFVYLDRKTGRVFAKSTKDILIKEFNRIKITPNVKNIVFDNDKSVSAQTRITNILLQAHATSLHVAMSVI